MAAPPDPDPYGRVSGEGCLEQLSHCPENNLGLAAGLPLNATALTFSEPMCPGGSSQSFPNSALPALHPGYEGLQDPPRGGGHSLWAKISLVTNASSLNPSPWETCQLCQEHYLI